jgi:carboxymethylenebutenolidase
VRTTLPSGTPAELVRPDADIAPRGGLVLFPDIMGLRPLFDEHCARLAAEHAMVVCAIEPWAGREALTRDERLVSVGELSDERLMADALAAAEATGCDRVGVLGFCMGGMLTFKAAATGRFDRAASFYGMVRLPPAWQSATMHDPVEAISSPRRCPVLLVVGTEDEFVPAGDIAEAEALGVEVVRYEGAEHGFVHDPARPIHREADAADAWRRVLAFLAA